MKLSSSFAFLSTALLVPFSEAGYDEMSQLQKNWNIGDVVATNVKNVFTFQYPDTTPAFLGADLSDLVRATIYGADCKEDENSAWYASAGYVPPLITPVTTQGGSDAFASPILDWSTKTTTYTNMTDGETSIIGYSTGSTNEAGHFADPLIAGNIVDNTVLVEFTFTTVPSIMAQISDITSAGGDANESSMDFCVRVGLYAVDDDLNTSNEINFQETLVTLTVTMDGSFDITSFGVAPKDKTSDSAQQTYTVSAELCTENQAEMDSTGRFNQGAAILVCISPDTQALIDGVIMTSIDTFGWKREYEAGADGIVPNPTLQAAITSTNAVSDNGLTLINIENTKSFIVTSVLFAAFYATNGQVSADGSATMAFPSADGVRRLRNLQDGDTSTVAPFEMVANLNKADDGPVAYVQPAAAATGAGTSITVVATIVGLVSAMLLA